MMPCADFTVDAWQWLVRRQLPRFEQVTVQRISSLNAG